MNIKEWQKSRMLLLMEFDLWVRKRRAMQIDNDSRDDKKSLQKDKFCSDSIRPCFSKDQEPRA